MMKFDRYNLEDLCMLEHNSSELSRDFPESGQWLGLWLPGAGVWVQSLVEAKITHALQPKEKKNIKQK